MTWYGLPVLRQLAEGPRLSAEVAAALGLATPQLKKTFRCLRARGYIRTVEGVHEITEAGRSTLEQDEEITCGPRKGRKRNEGSLRARAWRAMRIKEKFSLDDLLTLLCDGTELSAENNLRSYLRALEGAGYLVELKRRGPENTPRWWLSRDTGLRAPSWNRLTRTVADPNTGEVIYVPPIIRGAHKQGGAHD